MARTAASDRPRDASNHLIAQLRFAAPKAPQIVAQDLDHIVFIMSGLTCGVRAEEHMLHSPERRVRCERLFLGHIDPGADDTPRGKRLDKCYHTISRTTAAAATPSVIGGPR